MNLPSADHGVGNEVRIVLDRKEDTAGDFKRITSTAMSGPLDLQRFCAGRLPHMAVLALPSFPAAHVLKTQAFTVMRQICLRR